MRGLYKVNKFQRYGSQRTEVDIMIIKVRKLKYTYSICITADNYYDDVILVII